MRTLILGAGAMGALYGARLAADGNDVLLVEIDPGRLARYQASGVTVDRLGETVSTPVAATDDPGSTGWGPANLAVVFVKSYATAAALTLAAPLLGPDTTLLTLQNGWGNGDVLADHTAADRVLVGVSYHSAAMPEPGHVLHTAIGTTYIGPHDGASDARTAAVADAFTRAGIETEVAPAIADRIWRKLVMNCAANPTGALTGLCASDMATDPVVAALVRGLAGEAVRVARARGHDLPERETVDGVVESLLAAGPALSSMRQDVEAHRRTELDTITGALLSEADSRHVEVPMNRALHALIAGYEAREGFR